MVVTRTGAKGSFLSLSNVIDKSTHLDDDDLESVVANLCLELGRFNANYLDLDFDNFEISVAQLIISLDGAAVAGLKAESPMTDLKLEVAEIETKLKDTKALRASEFNDSLTAQDCLLDKKNWIKGKNASLSSSLH